jgi:hypothetical protein
VIGWYVHHVGLGHATRAAAVARHLSLPVTGLGSGPVPPGWSGSWVPLPLDDRDPVPAPDSDATAHDRLHWVPRHHPGLAERTARLCAWVAEHRPALVVVDVSVEVTLLARLAGVPVVVVALPGHRADRAHEMAYDVADALLAPWPAATHERMWPQRWQAKTWAVGGIGRFDGEALPPCPGSGRPAGPGRVLVFFGAGGRTTTAVEVEAARAATPGWRWQVREPGSPGDLWADLAAADVVVTHGGQNAVAEVAAARRPAVVVAQPRPFREQAATAGAVDALGIAVGVEGWPAAPRWPALLRRATLLGGAGWARWSTGRGAATAAWHLERLASTVTGPDPTHRPHPEEALR